MRGCKLRSGVYVLARDIKANKGSVYMFKIKLTQHKCYTYATVVSVNKNIY